MKAKLERSEVVSTSFGKAYRADFSIPGAKYVSRSFTWLLEPASNLGVMVVCSYAVGDDTTATLCQTFAESVRPVHAR